MMRRILSVLAALIILAPLIVVGVQLIHDPDNGQPSPVITDQSAQRLHGQYLARAGNCVGCHTARGAKQFAGGRAIPTPFGTIYSTNLTPDASGLGNWTRDDFWRAMHNGKSRNGSFLYPVFPYPSYTKVTRSDSDALFAYFQTLSPVQQVNRTHELRFPYNLRILLAFWRTLYFVPGEFEPKSNQSVAWNRGGYLVEGLGHCSACHTSRNALGGSNAGAQLGGGMIPMQHWYASALTADKQAGLGEWEEKDIADLLKTGVSQRAAVFGPMADVVSTSLQHLSDTDIRSIATYLKSPPHSTRPAPDSPVMATSATEAIRRQGAKLYEQQCAACHGADGKGAPPAYPPLAANRSLVVKDATNPVRVVLNGGFPPATAGNPRPYGMPPFGTALSDAEIAAVVSYVRASWGNQGAPVSLDYVSGLRGAPAE